MNRHAVPFLASLLLCAPLLPAAGFTTASEAPPLRLAAAGISLDQAVRMAQARFNARVVRADTENDGDRVIYRLRLLSADGRVFSVRVDARTGQFL